MFSSKRPLMSSGERDKSLEKDLLETSNKNNTNENSANEIREARLIAAMSKVSMSSKDSESAFAKEGTLGGERKGKFRNLIEIDVLKIDNRPYLAQITQEQVYNEIYRGYLNLPKENIHGIKCSWRGHPYVTIKVRDPIDIDSLPRNFYYMRDVKESDNTMNEYRITCEIRGVRTGDFDPNTANRKISRWVKIDPDCYDMNCEKLTTWLNIYGELLTEIEEDNQVVKAADENSDEEAGAGKVQLGKGLLSVKMEITKPLPEFLPIDGHRVRIFYRGMNKQCLNCYGFGHEKKLVKSREHNGLNMLQVSS